MSIINNSQSETNLLKSYDSNIHDNATVAIIRCWLVGQLVSWSVDGTLHTSM